MNGILKKENVSSTLYVGGIVRGDQDIVRKAFQCFGEIEKVDYLESKACAFVKFGDVDCAKEAMEKMQGAKVAGQSVRCGWAKERSPTPEAKETCQTRKRSSTPSSPPLKLQKMNTPEQKKNNLEQRKNTLEQRMNSREQKKNIPDKKMNTPEQKKNTLEQRMNSREQKNPELQMNTPDQRGNVTDQRKNTPDHKRIALDIKKNTPDQRRNSLSQRINTPDQRMNIPDQGRSILGQRMNNPDSRMIASDKRMYTPDQMMNPLDQRMNTPDKRLSPSIQKMTTPIPQEKMNTLVQNQNIRTPNHMMNSPLQENRPNNFNTPDQNSPRNQSRQSPFTSARKIKTNKENFANGTWLQVPDCKSLPLPPTRWLLNSPEAQKSPLKSVSSNPTTTPTTSKGL